MTISSELLTHALDSTVPGIIIVDKEINIIFWNQSIEKNSAILKNTAINKNLLLLFPEIQNSRIQRAIELCLIKGSASFISHEFNKKPFPLYVNGDKNKPIRQIIYIKPIQLENHDRYCLIQVKDSTTAVYREQELRRMAHEAESLSRLKSGFVSSVSHELRTPLTSIMGALGLLRSGIEDPNSPNFKNMLKIAYNNADRLLLLISDILDIEKIESGKMKFNFSEVSMDELIKLCIEQNHGLAEKYQVNFNYENKNALPLIHADKDRIFQVLNNLISNAAKFEPNGGTIEIATVFENNCIRTSVTDHGVGIPEEFKDKIFNAFTQADISNTKNIAGTGLGLAISKTIVEHHHGEIYFDSQPNKDTCFYFTMPVKGINTAP